MSGLLDPTFPNGVLQKAIQYDWTIAYGAISPKAKASQEVVNYRP